MLNFVDVSSYKVPFCYFARGDSAAKVTAVHIAKQQDDVRTEEVIAELKQDAWDSMMENDVIDNDENLCDDPDELRRRFASSMIAAYPMSHYEGKGNIRDRKFVVVVPSMDLWDNSVTLPPNCEVRAADIADFTKDFVVLPVSPAKDNQGNTIIDDNGNTTLVYDRWYSSDVTVTSKDINKDLVVREAFYKGNELKWERQCREAAANGIVLTKADKDKFMRKMAVAVPGTRRNKVVKEGYLLTDSNSFQQGTAIAWQKKGAADIAWQPKPKGDYIATLEDVAAKAEQDLVSSLSALCSTKNTAASRDDILVHWFDGAGEVVAQRNERGVTERYNERVIAPVRAFMNTLNRAVQQMDVADDDTDNKVSYTVNWTGADGNPASRVYMVWPEAIDTAEAIVARSWGSLVPNAVIADSVPADVRNEAYEFLCTALETEARKKGRVVATEAGAAFLAIEACVRRCINGIPSVGAKLSVVKGEQKLIDWNASGFRDASKELLPYYSANILPQVVGIINKMLKNADGSYVTLIAANNNGRYNMSGPLASYMLKYAWACYNASQWFIAQYVKSPWLMARTVLLLSAWYDLRLIDDNENEYLHVDRMASRTYNKDGFSARAAMLAE